MKIYQMIGSIIMTIAICEQKRIGNTKSFLNKKITNRNLIATTNTSTVL